jgi:hypothetical protein
MFWGFSSFPWLIIGINAKREGGQCKVDPIVKTKV